MGRASITESFGGVDEIGSVRGKKSIFSAHDTHVEKLNSINEREKATTRKFQ